MDSSSYLTISVANVRVKFFTLPFFFVVTKRKCQLLISWNFKKIISVLVNCFYLKKTNELEKVLKNIETFNAEIPPSFVNFVFFLIKYLKLKLNVQFDKKQNCHELLNCQKYISFFGSSDWKNLSFTQLCNWPSHFSFCRYLPNFIFLREAEQSTIC